MKETVIFTRERHIRQLEEAGLRKPLLEPLQSPTGVSKLTEQLELWKVRQELKEIIERKNGER